MRIQGGRGYLLRNAKYLRVQKWVSFKRIIIIFVILEWNMTKKGLVKGFTQPACSHRSSYVFYNLANSYEVNRTKTYDCKKKLNPKQQMFEFYRTN